MPSPRASPSDGPTCVDILTISTQHLIRCFDKGARTKNPQQAEYDDANRILCHFMDMNAPSRQTVESVQVSSRKKKRPQSTSDMRRED